MNTESLEERVDDKKNKLRKIKNLTYYIGGTVIGAGLGYLLGNEFGRDIADLVGVKSKFMGIERAIAGDMIMYGLSVSGAILGICGVYFCNKIQPKK